MITLNTNIKYSIFLILVLNETYSKEYLRNLPTCPTPTSLNTAILQTAADYAILAGTTITFTNPCSVLGNVGVSPGVAIGGASSPPLMLCGSIILSPAAAVATAQSDLSSAYAWLGAQKKTGPPISVAPNVVVFPGVYKMAATVVSSMIFDAQNIPNAEWIIQCTSTLITSAGAKVTVINGGSEYNIYWHVKSSVTFGANTQWVGNLVVNTAITFGNGCLLLGRALAVNAAVTLDGTTVLISGC